MKSFARLNLRCCDDQVPVVLYFDGQVAGPVDPKTEKREERTYKVLSSGSGYTIQLVN